jgi:flagellar motor switch protein FliM
MANNILTQDEVDALLNAVDQGELFTEDDAGAAHTPEGHTVSNYSFRRPHLITREQLRGVTNLHDDFAREFQSSLSISLQTAVDIRRVSAEQQQYNEFVFSLSDVTHITLFSMDPLPGKGVLELNLSLVFGIVDLFLGGEGDVESAIRKPTEVELAIIEPVVGRLFACLAEAIGLVLPVDIQPERVESSPEYVQAAPLDAPVVVLAFDVRIGLANGIINLCYPVPMVQSLLRELQGRTGQLDNYYGKVRPVDSRRQMLAA